MFKTKFTLIVTAAVIAVFAFMGAEIYSANASVKALTAEVKALSAEKATKQAEVDLLAQAVTVSSEAIQLVKDERILVIQLHKEQLASNELVATELANNQVLVNQLRQSNDEYIKSWANTAVPVSAVRMLKWAESAAGDHTNGSSESASVFNTAGITDYRLSAAVAF